MAFVPADPSSDRAYVISEWQALFGRNPTQQELDQQTAVLQSGVSRADFDKEWQKANADQAVQQIYTQEMGHPPSAHDAAVLANEIRAGRSTRQSLTTWLHGTSEAQLYRANPKPAAPSQDQTNARDYMNGVLNQYGLGSLSDWAWQEIQAGNSTDKVTQDLRNQPAYKARFPAMDARRAAGLPPINEAQYIQNEGLYRDIMRSNGMPPGFWDSPSDYTSLIANDISPTELQTRVQNGWAKVTTAPPEVRQAFARYFGAEGDTALASYFVDPTKSEAMLVKAADEARTGGFATLFGMNLSEQRAGQIYDFGKSSDQALQAFNQISQISPLFQESVSEGQNLTKEDSGINAALGLDATSQQQITTRLLTRQASLAGGGGAEVTSKGVGAGAANN